MRIASIIQRTGGTRVTLGASEYHFKPLDAGGPHLATVTDAAHIKRLLSITEGFEFFDTGEPVLPVIATEPASVAQPVILPDHAAPPAAMGIVPPGPVPEPLPTDPAEPASGAGYAAMSREDLAVAYEAMFGEKPHPRTAMPSIITKLMAGKAE